MSIQNVSRKGSEGYFTHRIRCLSSLAPMLFLLFCSASAAGAEKGWQAYFVPRFGISVEYPDTFTLRDRPPDNGDGQSFRTASGDATLRVFGNYNIDGSSSTQIMRSYRQAGAVYTYAKATKSWFVLSGTSRGRISYMRCSLGASDIVGCLVLEYPATAARAWSSVVGRVAASLNLVHPPKRD